jgi:hypothetical protein
MTCQRSLCYNGSIGLFHPSGETFLPPQCGEIFLIRVQPGPMNIEPLNPNIYMNKPVFDKPE